jgi:hypothetical protein
MLSAKEIDKMKADEVKKYLKELIRKLDELECEDFFGTEGWRHFLGYED